MKSLLFVAIILLSSLSYGQINFKTGDAGLEAELNLANTEAEKNLPLFKKDLSIEFGISIPIIEDLLNIMKPAEALLAAKIADIVNKPIGTVADSYKANKDKGWGQIAKELGIKPGSPEFHALKGKKKGGKPSGGQGNGNGNGGGKGKGKK
ncbi:MAG: hypothetical protein ACI837_003452 [Crocinitomicaceae bacterium]|jgi:hypothetical protein